MARYSPVDRRTWNDAKFRALGDDAKLVWLYLLTNPKLTCLPGVICSHESGLADVLRWPLKRFSRSFGEISESKMVESDFDAGLVWVRNAVKYDKPQSPNVVRSWAREFDGVPECELKLAIFSHLESFTSSLGEAFAEAFREAFPEAFAEAFREAFLARTRGRAASATMTASATITASRPAGRESTLPDGFSEFWQQYQRRTAKSDAVAAWRKLGPDDATRTKILAALAKLPRYGPSEIQYVPYPATWLNKRRWEDETLPENATGKASAADMFANRTKESSP